MTATSVYVTNAVKHFKYVQRGKRRLHQRPTAGEVTHYRWWLKRELDFVGPRLVVALGATAVLALAGKALPVGANRGEASFDNRRAYITVHPSYLLRLPGEAERESAYVAFRDDMVRVQRDRLRQASAAIVWACGDVPDGERLLGEP